MQSRNWTESLARACAKRPWVTIGVWIAAIVLAFFSISTLLGNALVTEVKPTNHPESERAINLMNQRLGITDSKTLDELMIVHSDTLTVDDAEFSRQVEQLSADLLSLGKDTVLGGATYYMTQDPSMVSSDRHSTLIVFKMPADGDKKIDSIYALGNKYNTGAFQIYHTGGAAFMADGVKLGEQTSKTGETIGISVALVVLAVVFGAIAAALLPVVLGVAAIIVALGLTALVGQTMDLTFMVTNMITMMGLAVGIDYSLFILTRYREERVKGLNKMDAIGMAGATASRAIFFSGLTVMLALAGLVIFPLSIFISMGIGALLVVFAAIVASLTLLPALLGLLGDKVNAIKIPFIQGRKSEKTHETPKGFWAWVTRKVTRAPVLSMVITVVILAAATVPFFDKKSGMSGISGLPDYLPSKQGYAVLQRDFHIGLDSPAIIVIDGDANSPAMPAAVARLQASLNNDPVFAATTIAAYPDKNMEIVYARLSGDTQSLESMDGVSRLRNEYIPRAFSGTTAAALVAGETAGQVDFNQTTSNYTPVIFSIVLCLSLIILTLAFRSIVISATAILMNLLSVGAAYGLIVLVFQKGIGADLFGFIKVETIETWLPLFLFAVLFGLSMDYQVFLLSRIRERFKQNGNNSEAVAYGLRSTGKLITGAALIMVAVFGAFALGDMTMMQQMGFGLAVAIFVDSTAVRCVLVPATMKLLGHYNWYLPKWLEWIPNVSLGEATKEHQTLKPQAHLPFPEVIPPKRVPVLVENSDKL